MRSVYLRASVVFLIAFVLSVAALFFFWKTEDYSGGKEVSPRFPVVVLDNGAPQLTDWSNYTKQVEQFRNKLIANSSGGIFELKDGKSFFLIPMEKGVLRVEVRAATYRQYADYSIEAGIARPHRLRVFDLSLLLSAAVVAFAVAGCYRWRARTKV